MISINQAGIWEISVEMRATAYFLVALGIGLLPSWRATTATGGSDCALIREDSLRLECYDLIFKKTTAPIQRISEWNIKTEISKVDDSSNVVLMVGSRDPVLSRYRESTEGLLYIMCRENQTNLSIWFADHFMSDTQGKGRVTYRIDSAPAAVMKFRVSNNNKYLGLWSGRTAISFINKLFGHDNLLVRATPFSDSSVTMEFPITGIQDAIKPLRKACHW